MRITVEETSDQRIVRLSGSLDLASTPDVRKAIENQIATSGGKKVVVDLSEVNHVDSAGLGVLVSSVKEARQLPTQFVFTGIQGAVKKVLEFTRLNKFFEATGSLTEKP
jgi:anti-sigma B factor antagonist